MAVLFLLFIKVICLLKKTTLVMKHWILSCSRLWFCSGSKILHNKSFSSTQKYLGTLVISVGNIKEFNFLIFFFLGNLIFYWCSRFIVL